MEFFLLLLGFSLVICVIGLYKKFINRQAEEISEDEEIEYFKTKVLQKQAIEPGEHDEQSDN